MNACTKFHARLSPFLLLLFMMVSRSTRGFLTWWCIDIDSIFNSRCQSPTLFFFTPEAVFFSGWLVLSSSGRKELAASRADALKNRMFEWRGNNGRFECECSGNNEFELYRMGRGASDTHTQTKTSVEIRDVSIYGKRSMSWIFRWYNFFFSPSSLFLI